MAATLNPNTTASTASSTHLNKTYYDRKLLYYARTKFVHAKYGQKRHIPTGGGKTVEFRRWTPFDPSLAVGGLTEGVTPEGQDLAQTHVEATVKQYGAYVTISDVLDKTAIDNIEADVPELLGEQMGTVLDWVTRNEMNAGTQVIYAGGKTTRENVAATDYLTVEDVRKAVLLLKKKKVRWFNGTENGGKARASHLICICSPESTHHLQNDEWWKDVAKYQDSEAIYSGEIGKMFGVVFIESTEAMVFTDAGASSADVHSTLIFGKDAYGVIDINGEGSIRSIKHGFGSAGTEDPLDQRKTIGAKIPSYAAKILDDNWIVRIESGTDLLSSAE